MRRFFVALFVFETIALACAAGQTASTASCGDYSIRAGETLKIQLKFDKPLDVDGGQIQLVITPPNAIVGSDSTGALRQKVASIDTKSRFRSRYLQLVVIGCLTE